jgi:hypothetical protein
VIRACPHCGTENTVAECVECGRAFVVTRAALEGRLRDFDDGAIIIEDSALPSLCDFDRAKADGRSATETVNAGMRQHTCPNCHTDFLMK